MKTTSTTILALAFGFAAVFPALTVPAAAQTAEEVLPVASDDITSFRSWKKWQIFQNNTRGHCFGTKSDESGVMQLGMTADESHGYIGVFVKEDVAAGASNEIVIQVGEQVFTGQTSGPVGNLSGDWHGGYVLANNTNFRRAIEKNDSMMAFPDQPYAVRLDISGANNAIFEIRKCTEEMGS